MGDGWGIGLDWIWIGSPSPTLHSVS
jgi:hypothetical protein